MSKLKRTVKSLKTIEEDNRWRNLTSIDTKTGKKTKNPVLIQKVKQSNLPDYEVVKSKAKPEYLRSLKNKKKTDNLDPKIKIPKKK